VWLSGLVTFEAAEQILERVGHIPMSGSSVWQCSQAWGKRFTAVEAIGRATGSAMPRRADVVQGEKTDARRRMGVAMDGAMVYVHEEGWKELKVGCVFDLDIRPTFDQRMQEMVEMAHAVHNSYVSHLGGPVVFGQQVWAEAQRRGWTRARDTQVLADGAVWVWNLVREHFYDSRQAVDWYHASAHLAQAANLLEGEGTCGAHTWLKSHETLLFQGHAARIASELGQAAHLHPTVAADLRREAGYFQTNQHRMQYLELREEGFAIGSGMVESGCKQFRARFCGSGMRWSRNGLEHLLPIRAAIMGHCFDSMWQLARNSPLN